MPSVTLTTPRASAPYNADFHAWALAQAVLPRAGRIAEADLERSVLLVIMRPALTRLFLISLGAGLCSAGAALAQSVGGYAASTPVTPFIANSSHTAGSSLGGLITLQTPASGLWQAITAAFSDGLTPSLDVVLFSDNPVSSTITDGAAVSVANIDLSKVIGVVHITDCSSLGTPTLCQAEQQAIPVVPGSGVVYVAVITRTAVTPDPNDMTLTVWALR